MRCHVSKTSDTGHSHPFQRKCVGVPVGAAYHRDGMAVAMRHACCSSASSGESEGVVLEAPSRYAAQIVTCSEGHWRDLTVDEGVLVDACFTEAQHQSARLINAPCCSRSTRICDPSVACRPCSARCGGLCCWRWWLP